MQEADHRGRRAEVERLRLTLYELELLRDGVTEVVAEARAEVRVRSPSCALRRRITTKPSCSIFRVCRARIWTRGLLSGANRKTFAHFETYRFCRVGPGNFTPSLSQIRT